MCRGDAAVRVGKDREGNEPGRTVHHSTILTSQTMLLNLWENPWSPPGLVGIQITLKNLKFSSCLAGKWTGLYFPDQPTIGSFLAAALLKKYHKQVAFIVDFSKQAFASWGAPQPGHTTKTFFEQTKQQQNPVGLSHTLGGLSCGSGPSTGVWPHHAVSCSGHCLLLVHNCSLTVCYPISFILKTLERKVSHSLTSNVPGAAATQLPLMGTRHSVTNTLTVFKKKLYLGQHFKK